MSNPAGRHRLHQYGWYLRHCFSLVLVVEGVAPASHNLSACFQEGREGEERGGEGGGARDARLCGTPAFVSHVSSSSCSSGGILRVRWAMRCVKVARNSACGAGLSASRCAASLDAWLKSRAGASVRVKISSTYESAHMGRALSSSSSSFSGCSTVPTTKPLWNSACS